MITANNLTAELQRQGYLRNGKVNHLAIGERFNSSEDEVYRLHLEYSSDAEPSALQSLICKQLAGRAADWQHPYECFFHETIAPQMPEVPIVKSYGCIRDSGKIYLLLEDLAPNYALATTIPEHQLERVTDLLVDLHAHWWQHPLLESQQFLKPDQSVCRMPQVLGEAEMLANFATAQNATTRFLHQFENELTAAEKEFLSLLAQKWIDLALERLSRNQPITLIHGDFHLLGNIFFARNSATQPAIKVIDWAQSKRGIGVHDLMYMLLAAESRDRVARDMTLIQRYHSGLAEAGISDYSLTQCLWDYQFSQLTNLFQSVFQESRRWFRKTFLVIEIWGSETLLR